MKLIKNEGLVEYYKSFLTLSEADACFEVFNKIINFHKVNLKINKKNYTIPREQYWMGDKGLSFQYEDLTLKTNEWNDFAVLLKQKVENFTNSKYNNILFHRYNNGNEFTPIHQDNHKQIGKNPTISILSLGATRMFKFKNIKDPTKAITLFPTKGSLIVMRKDTQENWQHQIPKQRNIYSEEKVRISLTFWLFKDTIVK